MRAPPHARPSRTARRSKAGKAEGMPPRRPPRQWKERYPCSTLCNSPPAVRATGFGPACPKEKGGPERPPCPDFVSSIDLAVKDMAGDPPDADTAAEGG